MKALPKFRSEFYLHRLRRKLDFTNNTCLLMKLEYQPRQPTNYLRWQRSYEGSNEKTSLVREKICA